MFFTIYSSEGDLSRDLSLGNRHVSSHDFVRQFADALRSGSADALRTLERTAQEAHDRLRQLTAKDHPEYRAKIEFAAGKLEEVRAAIEASVGSMAAAAAAAAPVSTAQVTTDLDYNNDAVQWPEFESLASAALKSTDHEVQQALRAVSLAAAKEGSSTFKELKLRKIWHLKALLHQMFKLSLNSNLRRYYAKFIDDGALLSPTHAGSVLERNGTDIVYYRTGFETRWTAALEIIRQALAFFNVATLRELAKDDYGFAWRIEYTMKNISEHGSRSIGGISSYFWGPRYDSAGDKQRDEKVLECVEYLINLMRDNPDLFPGYYNPSLAEDYRKELNRRYS